MNTASNIFAMGILASALASCGGGDSPSICTAEMHPVTCAAIANGGGPLFSTAPSQITLDAGADATYQLSGGSGQFTATSGNTNVARATVAGTALEITAVSPGTTQVVVVDTIGSRISLSVTVLAQGSGGAPLSLTPSELTIGNCTTRVPFIFTGGVPPYTTFTSDNFSANVSSALSLGDGRSFFFADIRYKTFLHDPEIAVFTVLDGQSRTAVATITTPLRPDPCPTNPLLTVLPESANFRTSEILDFQVSGGPITTNAPEVTFVDDGVAKVVTKSATTVRVQAESLTRRSTLMTVRTSDGQRASVVISVLPQPCSPRDEQAGLCLLP